MDWRDREADVGMNCSVLLFVAIFLELFSLIWAKNYIEELVQRCLITNILGQGKLKSI